jgi:hypothetical protein
MPHLYLPTEHTDADLVLAADIAAAVSSSDLYVTWTLESGQGVPEVEAVLRDQRQPVERGAVASTVLAVLRGLGLLWRAITGPGPQRPAPRPAPRDPAPAEGEPTL